MDARQRDCPSPRGFHRVAREDLEVEPKAAAELVLPLLDEFSRRDHQTALDVAADLHLLDQEPGHDRLAGAGVVREQETQRLPREHVLVNRVDLVRERLQVRRLEREERIEEPCELDPPGLGRKPEKLAVRVEGPGPAGGQLLEPRLVVAEENLLGDAPGLVPKGDRQRTRRVPPVLDDRGSAVADEPDDLASGREFFESDSYLASPPRRLYKRIQRSRRLVASGFARPPASLSSGAKPGH